MKIRCNRNEDSGSLEEIVLPDCVCKHDCFTDKDMLQLLERNCDTTRAGIKYCIDYAKTEYGDSKKLAVASEWLEQSTSKSHKNGKNF